MGCGVGCGAGCGLSFPWLLLPAPRPRPGPRLPPPEWARVPAGAPLPPTEHLPPNPLAADGSGGCHRAPLWRTPGNLISSLLPGHCRLMGGPTLGGCLLLPLPLLPSALLSPRFPLLSHPLSLPAGRGNPRHPGGYGCSPPRRLALLLPLRLTLAISCPLGCCSVVLSTPWGRRAGTRRRQPHG